MTTALIPFVNQQQSGWEEIAGASPMAMNVIVDPKGAVRRRPGISPYAGNAAALVDANGIAGLYATNNRTVIAVGAGGVERPIYSISPSGGGTAIGGGASPHGLLGSRRPVFAETEMLLVIAGGSAMQKVELATVASSRLGGLPPTATHAVAGNARLLANDVGVDRAAVRFSGTAGGNVSFAGHEVWAYGGFGTSGYFTAEARPDDVVALLENTNQVLVVGTGTTQTFVPDATLTYAPAGTVELGMSAPYSAVKIDQHWMWLDHKRRFVIADGRSFEDAGVPIKASVESIADVSDGFGYRVVQGMLDAAVWTFPEDGRTFAFQKGSGWGQWSGWNTATNNWAPLPVMSAFALPAWSSDPTMAPSTATTLVGTTTGVIGKFDMDASTDLGSEIPFFVRTGFLNRDTDKKKQCKSVRVAMRRGASSATPGPAALLRWADSPGQWSETLPVELGESGNTEIVVTLRSLGVYRRRQWEFRYDGTETLTLVSVSEEFEVLED